MIIFSFSQDKLFKLIKMRWGQEESLGGTNHQ